MITLEVFLIGLMVISTSTSLVTEAVKKVLNACNVKYHADLLAGIVSAVLSVGVGIGYVILENVGFTGQSIVCIIALAFMSWLGSMVGYDKVIAHIKSVKKDDEK